MTLTPAEQTTQRIIEATREPERARADCAEAALERVRKVVARLDGFAAVALTEPDRKLYAALAADLRGALTGDAPTAEGAQS